MFTQSKKDKYLEMPLNEKRKSYRCREYNRLSDIPTWQEESEKHNSFSSDNSVQGSSYPVQKELNEKVSLFAGDITTLEIDAIVNAANKSLRGGGGVDGAIHRGAGTDLLNECIELQGCETGDAKITGGYKLPAKYVIHTVGPVGEIPDKLHSCYQQCLRIMKEKSLKSIAFPCISTGIYHYPNGPAAEIALKTTREFLQSGTNAQQVDRVIFCLFMEVDKKLYRELLPKYFPTK